MSRVFWGKNERALDVVELTRTSSSWSASMPKTVAAVPNDCAHILAVDIPAFGDDEAFAQRIGQLAGEVTGARRAPNTDRLLLPGQLEQEGADVGRAVGVDVATAVLDEFRSTAENLGVSLKSVLPAQPEGAQ